MEEQGTLVFIYLFGNFFLTAILMAFGSSMWKKSHGDKEDNPISDLIKEWGPYGAAAMVILMLVNAAAS